MLRHFSCLALYYTYSPFCSLPSLLFLITRVTNLKVKDWSYGHLCIQLCTEGSLWELMGHCDSIYFLIHFLVPPCRLYVPDKSLKSPLFIHFIINWKIFVIVRFQGLIPSNCTLFLVPKALAPLRRSKVLVNMQPSYIDIYTDVYLYLAQPRI